MSNYKILITTTDSEIIANSIQKTLIEKKLSPCVHLILDMNSVYLWEAKIVTDKEIMLIIKTNKKHVSEVKGIVNDIHNYDTPELISIDFDILNGKYAAWFNAGMDGNR